MTFLSIIIPKGSLLPVWKVLFDNKERVVGHFRFPVLSNHSYPTLQQVTVAKLLLTGASQIL